MGGEDANRNSNDDTFPSAILGLMLYTNSSVMSNRPLQECTSTARSYVAYIEKGPQTHRVGPGLSSTQAHTHKHCKCLRIVWGVVRRLSDGRAGGYAHRDNC